MLFENNNIENIKFITVVNDSKMYNCYYINNEFLSGQNIDLKIFDNTEDNIPIPKRYNEFLNSYDYSKDAWFVFCHNDWEILDEHFVSTINKLESSNIYGPIGKSIVDYKGKLLRRINGYCLEMDRSEQNYRELGQLSEKLELTDTFDCQCLIVHSSLIEKINLRFDENLEWDLYVEDFCINAKLKHNIKSYTVGIKCCHHSDVFSNHIIPDSYKKSLGYINQKYPNELFAGTVSLIGGKEYQECSNKDYWFYNLRNKALKQLNPKEICARRAETME